MKHPIKNAPFAYLA